MHQFCQDNKLIDTKDNDDHNELFYYSNESLMSVEEFYC